jgi:hypothetical protein
MKNSLKDKLFQLLPIIGIILAVFFLLLIGSNIAIEFSGAIIFFLLGIIFLIILKKMKEEIPNRLLTLPVFMLLIGFLLTKLSRYQLPQWIETTNIDIGILYLSLPIYVILIVVVVITMVYIYWLRKGYEML